MSSLVKKIAVLAGFVVSTQLTFANAAWAQNAYAREQEQWRKDQQKELTKPNGWLSLAGLFWLKEGRNYLGAAPANDMVFPGVGVPPSIGVIELKDGVAWFTADPQVPVSVDGTVVRSMKLAADDSGAPTKLSLGTLTWNVIKRNERFGVRLRDSANPRLTAFTGMKWFPVKAGLRVVAQFTPYESSRKVPITNVLGQVFQMDAPGLLTFKIGRQEFTLEPVLEDKKLLIIFRDLSSGKETYGAGRFLYADPAVDGKVVLDFNQAVNPPCAFTPFATCPLPPVRNWLKVLIRAGELAHHLPGNESARGK